MRALRPFLLLALIATSASAQVISVNTMWSGTVNLDRDVRVDPGVTLTVAAGTTINAATTDAANLGTTAGKIELIVQGTLVVNGTSGSPVLFTSSGSAAGSWIGVRGEAGSTLTITSATIEEASVAVDTTNALTLTGSTLRNSSQGLTVRGGSVNATGSLFTGNSYGVLTQAGSSTIDHDTITSNTYGVYSSNSLGSVNVTNSVVANNSYGLYQAGSLTLSNSYNDVWSNGSGNYVTTAAGTGSLSTNPLFVGSGGTPFRLTSNSPARFSDAGGGDMGAFAYVSDATSGLVGTLWTSSTISVSQAVLGDLVVPTGVTITLAPGVTLTASTTDLMAAGSDTGRVELIVRGTLTASAASSNVTLTSASATTGSWTGVRVESGGTLNATGLIVERASVGIDSNATLTLAGSTLRNNSQGLTVRAGTATVSTTLLSGNSYGALTQAGSTTLNHDTIVSNTYGVYSSNSLGAVNVTNSVVTNNSYGLYQAGSLTLSNSYNDVWSNGSGNYVTTAAGTGSISSNPLFVGSGATPNRLTSNSPARFSDSGGTDMGAFAYVSDATSGLVGTLWTNTTLASGAVLGDVIVPAGVTVSLPLGVTLTASTTDLMAAGSDTGRVEIIVRGTLQVTGASTLTSASATTGSWTGVRVESGGTLSGPGLTVERASVGIDSNATLTLSDATLRNNSQGLTVRAGTANVTTSLFTGNSYGVLTQAGSTTLNHDTITSNTYGVYSSNSLGAVNVTNSVITNNSYGLYQAGALTLSNSYNDVWSNGSGNYVTTSAGTGSISSNPLFVGAGGTPYRLTSNSPARKSDSTGVDMGAYPYVSDATAGLVGTLWTNTTIATSQALLGDLIVPAGITVSISPGVTLTASTTDLMAAGSDTGRVELIVRGSLSVSASGNPVTLTSASATTGSWTGVRIESGGTLTANGLIVERASVGLDVNAGLSLSGSIVRNNSQGVTVRAGTASVTTSLLTGNSYGVLTQAGSTTIDHDTVVSNTYGVYSSNSLGAVNVTSSVVTNNSYGLYQAGALTLSNSYNDVWSNGSGNYVTTAAGTGSISTNPLFVGSGATPNRLTSNSPARFSDSTGGDMGAYPYVADATSGLVGTLWTNTTISTSQAVAGDLTVPTGITVTLAPGVTLTASTTDLMAAGSDTGRVELIVRGTLTSSAAGNPAVLTSASATTGSWTGVRVEATGNATLTGITISRASIGVEALGNVSLSQCELSSNSQGVRATSGSSTVSRCLLSGNSYGVLAQGAAIAIDHSTLVSNTYAVYSSSSTGAANVTNSVVTNNSYGLYQAGSIAISNSYNDVWSNGSGNYVTSSAGTGSISANPLYVGSGGTPYRLTSNSPARKSDSTSGDMGAFAYVSDATMGLVGTLWVNTTISTSQAMPGDLTVPAGITVTVSPGVVLTASTTDLMAAGSDTGRTELIVAGTLQLSGNAASPVQLTSASATTGSWTGVRVLPTGSITASGTTFSRGSICLELNGAATVSGSRFSNCSQAVRSNAGTHSIAFTVFDGNSYGVLLNGGADTLDHLTAYSNTYAVYGSASTGSVNVTNSIFLSNTYAMYRAGSTLITNSYNLLFNSPITSVTLGSNTTTTVDPQLVSPAAGDFHLQAGSPARGAGISSSDLGAFPFAPGAVDHLIVAPSAATVQAGGTFTFSATAYDVANNPIPSAVITWSALAPAGVITSGGVLTAACTPGSVTGGVTATSSGKTASANVTITTAPIASLVVSPLNVNVKSLQTQQFSVMALDACNNAVTSPSITWSVNGSAGIIDPSGLYTAGCTRGAAPMAIVATAGAVSGRASVTVDPGVLSTVSLSPTSATVAVNATRQFTGTAADGCGNPLTPLITYSTNVTGANVNTSGLFTAGTTPGTFPTGVTASASEGAVTKTASAALTITGGTIASVTVMPATATLQAGATANFMAVAIDGFGNMVAGAPTWSVVSGGGSINASSGLFTAGTTAGTFTNTVQATIGGVSGFASVIVQPGAITRVAISPSTVTLAPSGTTTFTAQAFDTNNNVVSAAITWSASASAGLITQGGVFTAGTMSGNYPAAITATAGSISATASVSINSGALSQLSITPAVAMTQAGGTLAFTASGRDGNNNTVAVTPVWSVVAGGGTINASGVFNAGTTTGTFNNTVRAESNGVTAFATVSVTAGPLVRLELTPASISVLPGEMTQFSGAGKDAFGNPVAATITWSTNTNAGSITANGLFTASQLPGDYADGVRAVAGAVMATASVRVRSTTVMDAGMGDAGLMLADAGVEDAGTTSDAGMTSESDAGMTTFPDGGSGMLMGTSSCNCSQVDAFAPLLGLLVLALRRRRAQE